MDLSTFAVITGLVTAATFGVVDRVKAIFTKMNAAQTVAVSVVVGFGTPFVLRASTFAKDIPVGDHNLSDLNGWAVAFIGLIALGGSSVLHQTLGSGGSNGSKGAIANIGQNQDPQ